MGMEPGTWAAVGAIVSALGTAASVAMTPTAPAIDTTDYDLLKRTREQADAESESAKARIEEARKREELRQQQMYASDVMTSDAGAASIGVRNQVLGGSEDISTAEGF